MVAAKMGYDLQRGRLDKTHHPFCTRFSSGDVRITRPIAEMPNTMQVLTESYIEDSGYTDLRPLLDALDGRPIKAVLKGAFASWDVGTVVELDNGQRWKVLKGYGKLRAPRSDFPVLIVPGVAGRWFMEFDENLPKARVYRID